VEKHALYVCQVVAGLDSSGGDGSLVLSLLLLGATCSFSLVSLSLRGSHS